MAYDTTGNWTPEDDSVEGNVNRIVASDSPTIQQARTNASQTANARGLLNSSINAGAGESAAIGAAMPMASQDASQTATKNVAKQQADTQLEIAGENVASNDRQQSLGAVASFGTAYGNMFNSIVNNPNIPATTRDAYLTNAGNLRDQDMNLLQQLYGITLTTAPSPGALPAGS